MASTVVMPKMGYDMEKGKIVQWLKREGDPVRHGEDIAEIETEKVNITIQAFADGVLRKVLAPEGESAAVGAVIAIIGDPDEPLDVNALVATAAGTGTAGESAAQAAPGAATPVPAPAEAPARTERLKVSPLASRLAAEKGVDLRQVQGTGPGGRITRDDVLRFVEQRPALAPTLPPRAPAAAAQPAPTPAPAPKEMAPMRQAIARRMAQSKREAPHFYVTVEIDMTEAMRLRGMLNEMADELSRVSVNDLIVKAVARALSAHRALNAHLVEER
ncbi:MAG: 2-oxo acid dehydrogenase subunit E2, partial [Armatimonadota bacterium]|nr:2-oxo acid dehydrogenase subunit E2 [Armatimonadota bacterium]